MGIIPIKETSEAQAAVSVGGQRGKVRKARMGSRQGRELAALKRSWGDDQGERGKHSLRQEKLDGKEANEELEKKKKS